MTNREIAQEISNRIGTAPVPFDSVYSIALQIYNELGGEQTQFDSVYSILLEILPLVEGGGGGKAIEEVSELPNASENKDKLFRLDNGEKDVYAAKLLSSETTTTNRLPDAQQIDKAYLYEVGEPPYYYKGSFKVIFSDTEIDGYGWLKNGETIYFILTEDNAENVQSDSIAYGFFTSEDDTIDLVNKTITTEKTSIETKCTLVAVSVSKTEEIPIPATYNAPESAQIRNAKLVDGNEHLTWRYNGTEVTITIDDEQFTGYKWLSVDAPDDYILTDKQASNIYFYKDNGSTYCDVKCYRVSNNIATQDYIDNLYIPQLNAPDSEQVDNATITYGSDYKYKGDTLCTIIDVQNEKTYTGYKWETDDNKLMVFTSLKASEIYGQTTTTIYMDGDGNDDWNDLGNNTYEATWLDVGTIEQIADSYSTIKYQRTVVTEVWGWQPLTDNATNDDIDLMFTSPVVKRILMKYGRVYEESGARYPLTILEGLVNVNGETMEYDGDTYYKWVKYEDRGNGTSTPDVIEWDYSDEVIVLTTSLNPTLPFSSSSPEWAYMIGSESEKAVYASPSTETYPKEALIHEDGSITYEE